MTLFEIVKDPDQARLIELLYEGYRMPYEEIKKELKITNKELDSLLDTTEGLWDTTTTNVYRLTERGEVAYGIIKSRNVKIKNNREANEKEGLAALLESLKEEISRRFL